MNKRFNTGIFGWSGIFGALLIILFFSCKKYDDPAPFFEDDIDSTSVAGRRVLLIGIDGAVAAEFKKMNLPAITALLAHSKFTWEGASDEITTDAASWKTLMSGLSFSKHQIKDSTFIYEAPQGEDTHGGAPPNYPSFFSYILSSSKGNMRTSFISPWNNMVSRLVPEVQEQVVTSNDQGVKDSALSRLKTGNPELMVLNFNSPTLAGKAGAFSADNDGYKNAAIKIDGYINELMTALKARPQYNKQEEWLVIIASTHGGTGNSYGGSSSAETAAFSIFYNEGFKPLEFKKVDLSSIDFKGRDNATVKGQVLNDGGLYDIGTGTQTIQVKIKGPNAGQYPHFFGKTAAFTQPGWTMFTNNSGTWCFSVRSTTSGEKRIQADAGNVFNNNWHTLTVVVYDSAGGRWVKRFTDGARVADDNGVRNLGSTYGSIASSTPLSLGWGIDKGYNAVQFNAADIMIFNTALSDAEVVANLCLADITKHPKYNNLIGFWPASEGFGGQLNNVAPGRSGFPFKVTGPFTWVGQSQLTCNITPGPETANTKKQLMTNSAIANTLFYWIRLPVNSTWGFEGSKWLQDYEEEFVK